MFRSLCVPGRYALLAMRISYTFRLKEPIWLEDHWPLGIMGGQLHILGEGRLATAIEVSFNGQSTDMAPAVEQHNSGEARATITVRDSLLPLVRIQLEKAFTYLQCYFDVEILIEEVNASYEAESSEEEDQIPVKGCNCRKERAPALIPYDMLTRAFMAGEQGTAPELEATLVKLARTAMQEKRYIDSFRYSFLLFDCVYGAGKFRTAHLKQALKECPEFASIVATALKERMLQKHSKNSDTDALLAASPTVEDVIDHLVNKRGAYFHGNTKRKDAWKPHEQTSAETLCLLALEIAMLISHQAAAPMFDDAFSQRHFEEAKRTGAIVTMNVKFQFRRPGETFDQNASMNIAMPGTKVTPKMAVYAAKNFLGRFEELAPDADLKSACCAVASTGEEVFDVIIHPHPADSTQQMA